MSEFISLPKIQSHFWSLTAVDRAVESWRSIQDFNSPDHTPSHQSRVTAADPTHTGDSTIQMHRVDCYLGVLEKDGVLLQVSRCPARWPSHSIQNITATNLTQQQLSQYQIHHHCHNQSTGAAHPNPLQPNSHTHTMTTNTNSDMDCVDYVQWLRSPKTSPLSQPEESDADISNTNTNTPTTPTINTNTQSDEEHEDYAAL